ncbi:MAG TPA: uroporphyrinogen decarboxylase family protein [Syntrophorhabdales bacterium]|nr:uroporphyrinogen decarboxylase family protein [Syntrophorhabdales bacterium]
MILRARHGLQFSFLDRVRSSTGKERKGIGMTSYERVMTAIGLKEPDRVPISPRTRSFCIKHAGLTMQECFEDPDKYVGAQLRMLREFAFDALADLYSGAPLLNECLGKALAFKGSGPPHAEPVFDSPDDLKKVKAIDLSGCKRMDDVYATVGKLKQAVGKEYPVVASAPTPFRSAALLRGVQRFYHDLGRNQSFVRDLLDLCLEACKAYATIIMDAGADIIFTSTSVASGDCISKEHYRVFVSEGHKELHALVESRKRPIIFHTCGDWSDRFDFVAEEGSNVMFVSAGTDMGHLKKAYGTKLCLMGNIDCVQTLLMGTTDTVEKACREALIHAAHGGGFILADDCEVPPETPVANLRALESSGLEYGNYPLRI